MSSDAITVSARGTIGYIAIRHAPFFPIVRLIVIIPNKNIITLEYFYHILSNTNIKAMASTGGIISQLTVPMLKELTIPVPPLSVQKELVAKAEVFETEISKHTKIMNKAKAKKEAIIKKYIL